MLGGMVDALSLPQHEPSKDALAVQKHQVTEVATHVRREAWGISETSAIHPGAFALTTLGPGCYRENNRTRHHGNAGSAHRVSRAAAAFIERTIGKGMDQLLD